MLLLLCLTTAPVHVVEASSNFVTNEEMFYGSVCQCCSYLKEDLQASVNEIKSMSEIIKILKDDLRYDNATKSEPMSVSACEGKRLISSQECCNCRQLENQLKEALNELSSVKLIVEILNKEIRFLKEISPTDSNADNSWSIAKSSNSHGLTTSRPSKEKHTTHRIPAATRYAVPVANRYASLANHYEPQEFNDRIPLSTLEKSPRFPSINNYKNVKGPQRKKTLPVKQPSLQMKHQLNKPNLQEPKKNEDGSYSIPTIVNGVTSVNYNAKFEQKYRDSIELSINKLRQTINTCNKDKYALSKKHRVILIGDSNMKGYGCNLKPLLSKNYELYSAAKPGSSSSELNETAKEEISQLSHEDVIVIYSGSNDYELNEFSLTLQNIANFIQTNKHTNITLINVPLRYDLPNSTSVNNSISIFNRKLKKLIKAFPHTSFLETENNRNLVTNHGLHLNKTGKRLVLIG